MYLYMPSLINGHRYTIIDEADEMLNADWSEELKQIMSGGGQHSLGQTV